jgi:DMSO/TMAO reductase YedYZ molybdopterin-dependent catalytic subunit
MGMAEHRLPPGQRAVEGFPRFGTHLDHPPPPVPAHPAIEVAGEVREPFSVPLSELHELPRREVVADFHCVGGWSALDLRWEGVAFETFYRRLVEPALRPGAHVTHVVLAGLDGYRAVAELRDAMGEDVLIADRLDGRPLDGDHGAPARFVSPGQYGFANTKHLCRVEVHSSAPPENYGYARTLVRHVLRGPLFQRHPRARVWHEERHRYLPPRLVRVLYRSAIAPIAFLSARGSERRRDG